MPAATNNRWNQIYAGWLYAAVATPTGGFDGLFVTKDFGENWTQVNIATALAAIPMSRRHPDRVRRHLQSGHPRPTTPAHPQYPITDQSQGNLDLSLAVDPTDPNILYLGGFGGNDYNSDTGLIRVDTTDINDAHSLVSPIDLTPGHNYYDLNISTNDPLAATTIDDLNRLRRSGNPATVQLPAGVTATTPFLNFIRDPYEPFLNDASLYVYNYAGFVNNGANVSWVPFDMPGTAYQASVAEVDPTTGLPRLIFGNNDGVWSAWTTTGRSRPRSGPPTPRPPSTATAISRSPSSTPASSSRAARRPRPPGSLFYGAAQNTGVMSSNFSSLTPGNLDWTTAQETEDGVTLPEPAPLHGASSVGVDQQGSGTLYNYEFPFAGSAYLNFVMVNGTGRTFGLLQASDGVPGPTDPQWPGTGIATLVVNPVNDQDVLISSSTGNIFATTDQGVNWFDIGTPATFGSPGNPSLALAYGAPDPTAPEGVGNLNNFIYVGTATGADLRLPERRRQLDQYLHRTWMDRPSSRSSPIRPGAATTPTPSPRTASITWPIRSPPPRPGSTSPAASRPWPTASSARATTRRPTRTPSSTTWPRSSTRSRPTGTTPSPIIRATWRMDTTRSCTSPPTRACTCRPTTARPGASTPTRRSARRASGGNLPHVDVTDLSLSQGNVAVATGMPDLAGPYNPEAPSPTDTFTGTLTAGSPTVTGVSNFTGMVVGQTVVGTGIPTGTTIQAIDTTTGTITLSAGRDFNGYRAIDRRSRPRPRPPDGLHLRRGLLRHQPGPDALQHRQRPGPGRRERYLGDRRRRDHPRHDRDAHHRRHQRDLRLRQRHLGHDRR